MAGLIISIIALCVSLSVWIGVIMTIRGYRRCQALLDEANRGLDTLNSTIFVPFDKILEEEEDVKNR